MYNIDNRSKTKCYNTEFSALIVEYFIYDKRKRRFDRNHLYDVAPSI